MQAARLVAVALSSLGEPDSVLGLHKYCLHTFAPLQLLLQRQTEQFSVGSDAARRLEFSWLQAMQLAVSSIDKGHPAEHAHHCRCGLVLSVCMCAYCPVAAHSLCWPQPAQFNRHVARPPPAAFKARSGGLLQAAKQYEAAAALFRKQLSARHSAHPGPSHIKFLMEQACLAYQAVADWSSLEDLIEVNAAIEA